MNLAIVIPVAAVIFGLCWLVDKGFSRLFRSKQQHRSGTAVRANKLYGIFSLVLCLIGILAIVTGVTDGPVLLIGGILVFLMGAGLAAYYLSFGIFYDEDAFLVSGLGKKSRIYNYSQIREQKLYLVQGGNILVELHMDDGTAVTVQSAMDGAYPFLDAAFTCWCQQTGQDPEDCAFHDPANHRWFPQQEEV